MFQPNTQKEKETNSILNEIRGKLLGSKGKIINPLEDGASLLEDDKASVASQSGSVPEATEMKKTIDNINTAVEQKIVQEKAEQDDFEQNMLDDALEQSKSIMEEVKASKNLVQPVQQTTDDALLEAATEPSKSIQTNNTEVKKQDVTDDFEQNMLDDNEDELLTDDDEESSESNDENDFINNSEDDEEIEYQNSNNDLDISNDTKDKTKSSIDDLISKVTKDIVHKKSQIQTVSTFGNKTMEQFLFDSIQPILREKIIEYLDMNLPKIVQSAVETEVKRIVDSVRND